MSFEPANIATFAAGCFWGVEHMFVTSLTPAHLQKGILWTRVGYTGGKREAKRPKYWDVCRGVTGHAKAVKIMFDPEVVQYEQLVEFFYRSHDPTTVNRQGPDVGSPYRSVIFVHSRDQQDIARRVTERIQAEHFTPLNKKIVTEIVRAGPWWDAEDHHQLYLVRNPGAYQSPSHKLYW